MANIAQLGIFRTPPIQGSDGMFVWAWQKFFEQLETDRQQTAAFFSGPHSDRLKLVAASNGSGSLFYETDRTVWYVDAGNNWQYLSGTYSNTSGNKPVDLGPSDIGFLFFETDTSQFLQWNGSAFVNAPSLAGPTGPAGATGPTGATGATGPTGPTGPSAQVHAQVFTGSGTFTIPTGVTSAKVTVVGGGGAGGGSTASAIGAGGGGGGTGVKWLTALTPGGTLTVTVGTGGVSASGTTGGNGVNSTVASGTQSISTITGSGGSGGGSATTAFGGGGGGASGGDINSSGGQGTSSVTGTSTTFAGPGGLSSQGGGAAGSGNAGSSNAAISPGSGGSGAFNGATGGGGAGANGLVIFEWAA